VGYVNTTNQPTESGNRQLPNKILILIRSVRHTNSVETDEKCPETRSSSQQRNMGLFSQYYGQTDRHNYSLTVVFSHSVATFSQFLILNVHTHTHTHTTTYPSLHSAPNRPRLQSPVYLPYTLTVDTVMASGYSLRSAHTVCLCVLCGSQNKQRLLQYTALTDWFV